MTSQKSHHFKGDAQELLPSHACYFRTRQWWLQGRWLISRHLTWLFRREKSGDLLGCHPKSQQGLWEIFGTRHLRARAKQVAIDWKLWRVLEPQFRVVFQEDTKNQGLDRFQRNRTGGVLKWGYPPKHPKKMAGLDHFSIEIHGLRDHPF